MLDYLLVSKSMIPRLRSVTMDLNSVWAPHCGLRVVVDATPCLVMVSKLWRPGAVPVGVVVDDKGRQKAASSTDGHWQQAQSWVGWQALGPPPCVLLGCPVTQLFGDEALVLGQRYLALSQQAEGAICIYFLQPEDNARRLIGRGRFPCIVQRPLIGKRVLPIDAVSSKAVRFWGRVRARITELCKLNNTDKGTLQQQCICKSDGCLRLQHAAV